MGDALDIYKASNFGTKGNFNSNSSLNPKSILSSSQDSKEKDYYFNCLKLSMKTFSQDSQFCCVEFVLRTFEFWLLKISTNKVYDFLKKYILIPSLHRLRSRIEY